MRPSAGGAYRRRSTFTNPSNDIAFGLGLLLLAPIAAASREGAGIGAGMALLVFGVLATVALVIVVAVASGIVIGLRRGAVGRQIGRHLLYGLGLLILAPIVVAAFWWVWSSVERAAYEREMAVIDTWLAPLEQPVTGELAHALSLVLDAEQAQTRGRRGYLIGVLPGILDRIEIPLDGQDRAAVQAAARRLRLEHEQFKVGSHPDNLERLGASVIWLLNKPDLLVAMQACEGRWTCAERVIELADGWCYRHLGVCRVALDTARLDAAEALVKQDRNALWKLQGLRSRVAGH
jgi:hypothetical protein